MSPVYFSPTQSIEKRREFADIPCNAHVPHYSGFVPQVQYRRGKSRTRHTHDVAEELPYYTGPKSKTFYTEEKPPTYLDKKGLLFKDETPGQKVPLSDGSNKYFSDMIPGYSGDIMRYQYHFGKRYRALTRDCIDEFINEFERQQAKMEDVEKHSTMFPALRPILGDPRVRDHINFWVDARPDRPIFLEDKRRPREAIMPGYKGYVPRQNVTETGLGTRFNVSTENSMNAFWDSVEKQSKNLREPYQLRKFGEKFTYTPGPRASLQVRSAGMQVPETRIYRKEGMIPCYNGLVPGYYDSSGYNFGDGTRQMECCNHDKPSYGTYLKSKMENQ